MRLIAGLARKNQPPLSCRRLHNYPANSFGGSVHCCSVDCHFSLILYTETLLARQLFNWIRPITYRRWKSVVEIKVFCRKLFVLFSFTCGVLNFPLFVGRAFFHYVWRFWENFIEALMISLYFEYFIGVKLMQNTENSQRFRNMNNSWIVLYVS